MQGRANGCYTLGMIDDDIKDAVHQEPFVPFRIVTSSGESYVVRNPDLVVPMRNRVFIAMPDGERCTFVPYLHVTAVETMRATPNGKPRRPKK